MSNLYAFFIQYQVSGSSSIPDYSNRPKGIATIIVFAESEQTARIRAGKMIASKKLKITDFLRIHLIQKSYVKILDTVLRSLYIQAELYGIAIHCDLFKTDTPPLNLEHNQPE